MLFKSCPWRHPTHRRDLPVRRSCIGRLADRRRGLATAKCISRDYTGVGLYTELLVDPSSPKLNEARWKIEDMPTGDAEHPDLPAGAGLILWVKDGYISCLESYTYEGSWPENESLFRLAT